MATYTEQSLEAERASLPRADDSATGNVNSIQQPPNPKQNECAQILRIIVSKKYCLSHPTVRLSIKHKPLSSLHLLSQLLDRAVLKRHQQQRHVGRRLVGPVDKLPNVKGLAANGQCLLPALRESRGLELDVGQDEAAGTAVGAPAADDGREVKVEAGTEFSHAYLTLLDQGHLPGSVGPVAAVVDAHAAQAARGETVRVIGGARRARHPLDVAVEAALDGDIVDRVDRAEPVLELVVELGADLCAFLLHEAVATAADHVVHLDREASGRVTHGGTVVGAGKLDVGAEGGAGEGRKRPVGQAVVKDVVGHGLVGRALLGAGLVARSANAVLGVADLAALSAVVGVVAEIQASVATLVTGASTLSGTARRVRLAVEEILRDGEHDIPDRGGATLSSASSTVDMVVSLGVGAVIGAIAAQACVGGVRAEAEAHGVLGLVVHLAAFLSPNEQVKVMSLVSAGDGLDDVPPALERVGAL